MCVCVCVCVFVCVSDTEQGTQAKRVQEQGSEEDIGPKRDDVTGEWITLQETTETNYYYSSSSSSNKSKSKLSPLLTRCSEKLLKIIRIDRSKQYIKETLSEFRQAYLAEGLW